MRDRFRDFMYGRYGMDQLSRFLSFVALILLILSMFIHIWIFYIAALAVLAWSYFRVFSRNTSRRYAENERFLGMVSRVAGLFRGRGAYQGRDRAHRYFTCPQCRQKVRVPRGKGKICITCPRCRREFIRRT